MRVFTNSNGWRLIGLALIVGAGSLVGAALGNFATGGASLRVTPPAQAEERVLGNPDALSPDVHQQPIDYEGPQTFDCRGCGPSLSERRAMADEARIRRMMARSDFKPAGRANGYGYDDYGNVYYDDGTYDAMARGMPEIGTKAAAERTERVTTSMRTETIATAPSRIPVSVSSTADKD